MSPAHCLETRHPKRRPTAFIETPVAAASVQEMVPSPALQIIGKMKDTLMGRAIGILITDGSDGAVIEEIRKAATDAGATVNIVAPQSRESEA